MKKSTRLNHMLIYINEKQSFQLRDLMQEFKILKSTALRDIKHLEELGVPLYCIYGKHGKKCDKNTIGIGYFYKLINSI